MLKRWNCLSKTGLFIISLVIIGTRGAQDEEKDPTFRLRDRACKQNDLSQPTKEEPKDLLSEEPEKI